MKVIVQKKLFIQISNSEGTGYCDDPGVCQEKKRGRGGGGRIQQFKKHHKAIIHQKIFSQFIEGNSMLNL